MRINRIKCYTPFALNTIKRSMAYRGAFFITLVSRLFTVFVIYFLWKAIYGSSVNSIIRGFSFPEMTAYITMNFLTGLITGITGSLAMQIAFDVSDGSIAIQLVRPISYRLIKFSESLGGLCGNGLFQIIPFFFIFIVIGFIKVPMSINFILYLYSAFLGFLCMFCFGFFFGLFSFYTTYFFGFNMAMSVILQFFSGSLIPLTFFPEYLERIFRLFPFASMNYTPIMIYLGKLSEKQVVYALMLQMIWILLFYLAGKFLWSFAIKRLTILGG